MFGATASLVTTSAEDQRFFLESSSSSLMPPDTSEYGGGAKPNEEQAKEEAVADANALRNGAVTIVVQEPIVESVHYAKAIAKPERDKQDVVYVSACDGSIDLPVPTDLLPSEAKIDVTVMVWHLYLFGYVLVVYVCAKIVEGSRRAGINRMYIVADSTSLWSPI